MTRKDKYSIDGFKYPALDKVASRISTICRLMASTMMERKACSIDEESEWKQFFSDQTCAYCGTKATHLDHLFPLVEERLPTGYGTDPSNLVSYCSRCNQKKGNKNWREYMNSAECVYEGDKKTGLQNFKYGKFSENNART